MERAQELHNLPASVKEQQQQQQQAAVVVEDRGPRPHRCNDRLEDFVQALFEGDLRKNLPGPAKLFWRCYKSKPGEEPKDPFSYLEEDENGKLVPKGRRICRGYPASVRVLKATKFYPRCLECIGLGGRKPHSHQIHIQMLRLLHRNFVMEKFVGTLDFRFGLSRSNF